MSYFIIFFLIPFLIMFFLLVTIEILLIAIIFLLAGLFALILFHDLYFLVFLAVILAATIYLTLQLGNLLFKKSENKKLFKFIVFFCILLIMLSILNKRIVHTEIKITDDDTGEQSIYLENFVN